VAKRMDQETKTQLVRELNDTLRQLVMLTRSGLPIRCRFCQREIPLEHFAFSSGVPLAIINKGTSEDGVYHMKCHKQAFAEDVV